MEVFKPWVRPNAHSVCTGLLAMSAFICILYTSLLFCLINLQKPDVEAIAPAFITKDTLRRDMTNSFIESFQNFAENIKTYFKIQPAERQRTKRTRIKDAFSKFLDDSLRSETRPSEDHTYSVEDGIKSYMHAPEMIVIDGYTLEIHTVRTLDGYHLTVHRIPATNTPNQPRIVLLHHGLLGSADDWVLLGPGKALPYLLANAGCDVWLANARGNRYSRSHVSRRVDSREFWSFSWNEIGHFDLSATIDYIRKNTDGTVPIDFIGHSMGATALLVLLSTLPQYNPLLRSAIFLAPLAFMYNVRGPIRFLAEFIQKNGVDSLSFLGEQEFMRFETFPKKFVAKFCAGNEKLCANALLFLANGGKEFTNKTLSKIVLDHVPAGGSTKTIVHYCQLIKSGQFQMFDFGLDENVRRYGITSPPTYRLNDVTIPVVTFTSADDWLSSTTDALSLMPNLPSSKVHHVIKKRGFSHTDFLWSDEAPSVVYHSILQVLEHISPENHMKFRHIVGK